MALLVYFRMQTVKSSFLFFKEQEGRASIKVRLISKYADGSGIIAALSGKGIDVEVARNRLESFLKAMYPSLEILERPEKLHR